MLKELQRPQMRLSRPPDDGEVVLVSPHFNSILRHKWLILRVIAVFGVLAVLFALLRHDSYTAVTRLQVDNKTLQLGRQDAVFARSEVDVPLIQNQIELLRSETIAGQIIDSFKLMDDPDFSEGQGFLARMISRGSNDRWRLALESFKRRLYVGRVGDSYTVEIRFTAGTAEQAANIANKIGEDYINILADTNAKLAQSASPWLRPRLKDMGPNASVITAAMPPLRKDGPSSIVVLAAALLAGLMFGVTGALAADVRDRSLRTPYQVAAVTGAECLGVVPHLKGRNLLFQGANHPKSHLAHALRRTLAAVRDQADVKIVGVVSALPGEGRTFIAANLAQVAAASGSSVLLVDAANYSGKLSRLLAPEAKTGLGEVLARKITLPDALRGAPGAKLKFLPIGSGSRSGFDRSNGCSELQNILSQASTVFDLIVVDLPPMTLVADVREVASAFDGFLLVVEWGRTPREVITSALAGNDQIQRRLLGTILNKVEISTLRTYDGSLSALYDLRRYATYLNEDDRARRSSWFGRKKKGVQPP
jgi:succinoglycan biosynthesis transport protein ExoP